jgi:hypothetical protein
MGFVEKFGTRFLPQNWAFSSSRRHWPIARIGPGDFPVSSGLPVPFGGPPRSFFFRRIQRQARKSSALPTNISPSAALLGQIRNSVGEHRRHTGARADLSMLRRRALAWSSATRQLSTMSASNTPMEDAIRTKVKHLPKAPPTPTPTFAYDTSLVTRASPLTHLTGD